MGKTNTPSYRPAIKVNKYINYYTNGKEVPIDYRFTSYKPANPSTGEKKNYSGTYHYYITNFRQ